MFTTYFSDQYDACTSFIFWSWVSFKYNLVTVSPSLPTFMAANMKLKVLNSQEKPAAHFCHQEQTWSWTNNRHSSHLLSSEVQARTFSYLKPFIINVISSFWIINAAKACVANTTSSIISMDKLCQEQV